MFKVLILQAAHGLSDERAEYLIKDRLSFMRFPGLGMADAVPDGNTIWTFREPGRLTTFTPRRSNRAISAGRAFTRIAYAMRRIRSLPGAVRWPAAHGCEDERPLGLSSGRSRPRERLTFCFLDRTALGSEKCRIAISRRRWP